MNLKQNNYLWAKFSKIKFWSVSPINQSWYCYPLRSSRKEFLEIITYSKVERIKWEIYYTGIFCFRLNPKWQSQTISYFYLICIFVFFLEGVIFQNNPVAKNTFVFCWNSSKVGQSFKRKRKRYGKIKKGLGHRGSILGCIIYNRTRSFHFL